MTVFISFFAIFVPTLIFPQSHKILRNKSNYIAILVMCIVLLILSINALTITSTELEKQNALSPICPIVFLLLYKVFDKVCLKKYGRNMYFHIKHNYFWEDGESEEATWLEFLLQFSLLIIPFMFWWKIGPIITKLL
ncbi:hypothetical protein WMW71_12915 [Flavobacterium buctense]|uniref:Uncharacterized protein n=1 Tax=Flavobacterium buctense TaxID=1648146 RepID=A0ABU9E5K9_9FLAO|nr:hypothetical protein [Flavobacterium buctense]